MKAQLEKTTYAITFNKDKYAFDSEEQPLLDWDGKQLKSYHKGQTIEVSAEVFALLVSNDGISDCIDLPIYDKRAYCSYSVKDIDIVRERVTFIQTKSFLNTVEGHEGISAWADSNSATTLCDNILQRA